MVAIVNFILHYLEFALSDYLVELFDAWSWYVKAQKKYGIESLIGGSISIYAMSII